MDHNRAFARNRLRGLALQLARGMSDRDFAELGLVIVHKQTLAESIRKVADAVAGADR